MNKKNTVPKTTKIASRYIHKNGTKHYQVSPDYP